MRNLRLTLLITLFAMPAIFAQIKIGDNPQAISPTSVLELESNDRVLVITRIDDAQMNAIVPNQGALVYNTDSECIHYYDGTQWVNLCDAAGFEVAENSISSIHIVDYSITGDDIQGGSIGPGKLQNESVTQEKLGENSVGAFALDNANIGVSAFNNDVGYITAADLNIVSAAAGNVITENADGAYYDDSALQAVIQQNTAAIALDNDKNASNEIQTLSINSNVLTLTNPTGDNIITLPSTAVADGSETIVTQGTNVTITGDGTTATPYIINATGGTAADGSETIVTQGTNVTITGDGTAATPYIINATGGTAADGSETIIDATNSNITVTGTGTTLDPYVLVAAGSGNEQSVTLDAATNQIDLLNDDSSINSSVKLDGTSLDIFNNGTDDLIQIAENGVTLDKLAHPDPAGTPADGDVMVWDNTALEWKIEAQAGEHTGTAKAIFFAGPDGKPTTTDDNVSTFDNGGLLWDSNARTVGTEKYGALFVGLNGNPRSDEVKVHIADSKPGFAYALELQNRNNGVGTTTGILFSTEGSTTYGKGGLVYERTGGYAVGDFHFLQNSATTQVSPTITDKAFTIKNNKDIVVYRGIDVDGTGTTTGLGTAGQVLTSTGVGTAVEWTDKGGATLDSETNDGLTHQLAASGYDINVDDATIEINTDALRVKAQGITTAEIADATILAEDLNAMGATTSGQVLKWNGTNWAPGTDAGGITLSADIPNSLGTGTDGGILYSDGDSDATNEIQIISSTNATIIVTAQTGDDYSIAVGEISGGPTGVIAANSITANDLSPDSVDKSEIRIDAVGQSEIESGGVATDEILDGTITNIDIAAGAAIDGSKINPDFGGQNVTANSFISATTTYPDYVFQKYFYGSSEIDPFYEFQTISEIEEFVKQHNHLPGVTSYDEIQENNSQWNITEGALKNLEKIEELFLHTIEQENKIKSLQSENETLSSEVKAMKKDLEEIKALLKASN